MQLIPIRARCDGFWWYSGTFFVGNPQEAGIYCLRQVTSIRRKNIAAMKNEQSERITQLYERKCETNPFISSRSSICHWGMASPTTSLIISTLSNMKFDD